HVNAWGLPYLAPMSGAGMVMPGQGLDGPSLFKLMDDEDVSSAWGVPTVWLGLLAEMAQQGRKPKALSHVLVGGSAVPPSMLRTFEETYGISVVHGWGMTEMSPVGSLGILEPGMEALPQDEQLRLKAYQGRRMYGVDLKIVDEDGTRLPHDGEAIGELAVRGNCVVDGYYNDEEASAAAMDGDGWFRTGDVASISPDGFLMIVDRTKDLVKSGGEWISSIDLENAAMAHPEIAECAVIAAAHPKWDERPLLIVVPAAGADLTKEAVIDFLTARVAKWWLPDDVVFVDELPHGATGKVSKLTLRAQFKDYVLPTA
ncbi:MAG: AMP-binding protein, partial [Thalassobaculaceae bacterium]